MEQMQENKVDKQGEHHGWNWSTAHISLSIDLFSTKLYLTFWSVSNEIPSAIPWDDDGRSSHHIRLDLPVKPWGHHSVPWMLLETSEHILSTI